MATVIPRTNRQGEIIGWQAKLRRKGFAPEPASMMHDSEKKARS